MVGKRTISPLTRRIKKMKSPMEQTRYNTMVKKAARLSRSAGPSVGSVSQTERHAIRKATRAVRLITTPAEARGVKKQLRKKARKS